MMHIHILGICGTFMGGIALLARTAGYKVSGSDCNVYPPMSTQLDMAGIHLYQGYDAGQLSPRPDLVVVGNAMTRGLPVIEAMLDLGLPYASGPQWLAETILKDKWVLAVSGTHGKTTTTALLSWMLDAGGMNPGFLIGGVPLDFGVSARLTDSPFFVIEADEYDTAFFDKRSKFVHYRPRTLIINNLEFDHADIFPDLDSIKRQFHHLVRTVSGSGLIVVNAIDENVSDVLKMGCWTPVSDFGLEQGDWHAGSIQQAGHCFDIYFKEKKIAEAAWDHIGRHNIQNALAAIIAARHVGLLPQTAIAALKNFQGVKRRLELRCRLADICIYDDFAHHPTAINVTLQALREQVGKKRVLAVFEPRSNTMRMGVHSAQLLNMFQAADIVWIYRPPGFQLQATERMAERIRFYDDVDELVEDLTQAAQSGDSIVIMSNGSFQGLHDKLINSIEHRFEDWVDQNE